MGCAVWSFPTQHVRVPVAPHPRHTWYISHFDVSQSRGCKEGAFCSFNLRFLRNKNIEHFPQTCWPFASFFFFFFKKRPLKSFAHWKKLEFCLLLQSVGVHVSNLNLLRAKYLCIKPYVHVMPS